MKYYIGIDGGGTKTAVVIGKEDGEVLHSIKKTSSSYKHIGTDGVLKLISESVKEITESIGASADECGGCCIGLPCYGESPVEDVELTKKLKEALAPIPVVIVNDVVVGWAGSLECSEGIHLVAGTGAIAYSKTNDGKEARSNGWSEFFSDEGSCYWIGKQTMSLFAKEADGRKPKGALYDIVTKEFNLRSDIEFIDIAEREYAPHREKVASFQLFTEKAALAGDREAENLYAEAAQHLADTALGIIHQLGWEDRTVPVSYFGGLFKSGDLILCPLREKLNAINCTMAPPKHTAEEGALLLSIKIFK